MTSHRFSLRLEWFIAFSWVTAIPGCGDPNRLSEASAYPLDGNLLISAQLFQDATDNRAGGDAFDILHVSRQNDTLYVTVNGPRDVQAYRFVWDGLIQESFPMGIRLVLAIDDSRGPAGPDRIAVIPLNVRNIIDQSGQATLDDAAKYRFQVINGSKPQTVTAHPDGTVTSIAK